MKSIKLMLLSLVAIVFFSSCSNDDEPKGKGSVGLYVGQTTVTSLKGGTFVTDESIYGVSINEETMTAEITIEAAQFAQMMPKMDMVFRGISVATDGEGGYLLTSESLIPEAGGDEYPNRRITDLQGAISVDGSMILAFVCNITMSVQDQEITMPYNVMAELTLLE